MENKIAGFVPLSLRHPIIYAIFHNQLRYITTQPQYIEVIRFESLRSSFRQQRQFDADRHR